MSSSNESLKTSNNPQSEDRLRILISSYACEPGKGSEAGVGWNMATQMSRLHEVYLLTRANNREPIEAGLPPDSSVNFIYYDLPKWARWWKRGPRGAQIYYYLWQVCAGFMLRKKYAGFFDAGHHVTFVRYWMPTCFPFTDIPYLIGPVGGGEMTPLQFENRFPLKPLIYEKMRRLIRSFVPFDPFVRASISRSSCVLSTTRESAAKIRKLGAQWVELYPESGLSHEEYERLAPKEDNTNQHPIVFVSSGRLLALKGFDLGLKAFARSGLEDAEYWVIGDGPERRRLESLTKELGIIDKVSFKGWVQREKGMAFLARAHVLVHPSLHDSGGWVCPEAMGMGKAVICLDLGGPAAQISEQTGISIAPARYEETIDRIAEAMRRLAGDRNLLRSMGEAGRQEVSFRYVWENKCRHYSEIYQKIASNP